VPDPATICALLKDPKVEREWLEIFLIELAGARLLPETIPALVDRFRVDTDYMLECCARAIARMGDPAAVRLIKDAFPHESWNFKNYTSGVLGAIKHPESEEAILSLLESEENLEIRTDLCLGLCKLFSERGVEVVQQQIRAGYEGWMVTLEEELLPVMQVLGLEPPEAERWRRRRTEREHQRATRRAEWDEIVRHWADSQEQDSERFSEPGSFRDVRPEAVTPIRRHEPRIGRNDPCPCGSGRKYKRCCGRE